MFKYIVSAILSFGTTAACYTQEIPQEVKLPFGVSVHPSMVYAASGNMHLMVKDFDMALEDFRRASFYAEQCDKETSENVESMVLFGQVIAYDNLNDRAKCEQALSALILLSKDDEEEIEEYDEDDEFWDNFSLKNADEGVTKLVTVTAQLYLVGEFYKMLHNLASLAPSEDIRTTLIALLDEECS